MSFAAETKKELTHLQVDSCCHKAELAAFIQLNALLVGNTSPRQMVIATENAAIARRMYSLLKGLSGFAPEVKVQRKMQLKKNNVYFMQLKHGVEELLHQVGMEGAQSLSQKIPAFLVRKNCCKRSFLRGAFLAAGSVNSPEGHSYHLEISCADGGFCHQLSEMANHFGVNAKSIERKKEHVLYVKEGEKITQFLRVIGAYQALLRFEDVRIVKDMRNSVNRLVNCETANLNKTVEAAMRQIDHILLIQEQLGLENLPRRLEEMASIRLQYPEANLAELGELMPSGKVGKSGVNHRLRKLEQIAQGLAARGAGENHRN